MNKTDSRSKIWSSHPSTACWWLWAFERRRKKL